VPVTTANGSKFVATNFAYSGNLSCGVVSGGAVWCWGSNSYGQLGIGTTMPASSTLPVQVLMGTSGPALANATKVFVDSYSGYSACAVDNTGAVWCWGYGGYGLLGSGTTNNSLFAAPVLTQSGGPQLTGVDQVSISNDHMCAHKTDGSAWCWGSNSNGQIGVGNSTQTQYLYPAQVTNLSNSVTSVSAGSNTSCASTSDGSVWCWGDNSYGILGNGLRTGQAIVPAQIAVGDAGTPFGGATRVELMYYGYSACALKGADSSLWCWGYYAPMNSLYPVQYTESMVAISNVFILCSNQQSSNSLSFIDARGAFHTGGSASTQQVACP
jgi:alpha-tubulin suppressor-like RCC1 family protein